MLGDLERHGFARLATERFQAPDDMPSIVSWVSDFSFGWVVVIGFLVFIIGLWIKKKIIESAVISANTQSNKSYDEYVRSV